MHKNQASHFSLLFHTDCFMSLGALKCFSLDRGCSFGVNAVISSANSAVTQSVEWCLSHEIDPFVQS